MLLAQETSPKARKKAASARKAAAKDRTVLMPAASNDSITSFRGKNSNDFSAQRSAPWGAIAVTLLLLGAVGGGGFWFWQQQTLSVAEPINAEAPVVEDKDQKIVKLQSELLQADSLATERAAELAEIKAERAKRAEQQRLEEEQKEAERLAEEARLAAQAKQAEDARLAELEKKQALEAQRLAEKARKKELAARKAKFDNEAKDLVAGFIATFKRKDHASLVDNFVIPEDKQVFVQQLMGAYQSFSLSSARLESNVANQTARTVITITSIRSNNGSIVKPGAAWRDIPVEIKKSSNGQLKLYWL